MSSEVDPKTIKTTQDLLSKIIKKPVLSDKLLKRPPFRFLHDILTNIIKSNGFMKGLFTADDMIADNIKDKDSKIVYLQKALDVTGFIIGDIIEAKAAKIVAGLECDKTNQWLQIVAKSVITKKDSSDAVQRVLNGEKPTTKTEKTTATKQKTVAAKTTTNIKKKELTTTTTNNTSNNKETNNNNKQRRPSVTKDNAKTSETNSKLRTRRESVSKVKATTSTSKQESNNKINSKADVNHANEESIVATTADTSYISDQIEETASITNNNTNKDDDSDEGYQNNNHDNNTNGYESNAKIIETHVLTNGYASNDTSNDDLAFNSAVNNQEIISEQEKPAEKLVEKSTDKPAAIITARPETAAKSRRTYVSQPSARPPTAARQDSHARPSSSRPAPPRVLTKTAAEEAKLAEAELEEKLRQQSVKPVQNLIIENTANETNNDDDLQDDSDMRADIAGDEQRIEFEATNNDITESKGSLVKQLIDTKKELEAHTNDVVNNTSDNNKTAAINRIGNREIEKLRQSIQSLSQCVNPLAKVLDYLQEDIDSMVAELKQWREEYSANMRSYERLRNSNPDDLEPLQNDLNRIDTEISEQSEKIVSVKANIVRNEERLQSMVTMISKPLFD